MTRTLRSPLLWSLLAALPLLAEPVSGQAAGGATPQRHASEGVYTSAQAARGEGTFRQSCASCHTMSDFSGATFLRRWTTVGSLFDVVSSTMPQDLPGGLQPEQYADVLAYFLSRNDFPAGQAELPSAPAALRAIGLQPRPR